MEKKNPEEELQIFILVGYDQHRSQWSISAFAIHIIVYNLLTQD